MQPVPDSALDALDTLRLLINTRRIMLISTELDGRDVVALACLRNEHGNFIAAERETLEDLDSGSYYLKPLALLIDDGLMKRLTPPDGADVVDDFLSLDERL